MKGLLLAAALTLPLENAALPNGARLVAVPCPGHDAHAVEFHCGRLYPSDQSGSRNPVYLSFTVMRPEDRSHTTPVLALPAGPGQHTGLDSTGLQRWSVWLARSRWQHDIVLFDLLGSGESSPRMRCPEVAASDRRSLTRGASAEADFSGLRAAVNSCRKRIDGQGLDASRFGVPRQLDAITELLTMLGGSDWNYWGISYGSRLAWYLAAMDPGRVRGLVLDSVFPPGVHGLAALPSQMSRALNIPEMYCRRGGRCPQSGGPSERWIPALQARLANDRPVIDVWADPDRVVLSPYRLAWLLLTTGYRSPFETRLASRLSAAARGDLQMLEPLLREHVQLLMGRDFDYGAYYAVTCSEQTALAESKWKQRLAAYPESREFVEPAWREDPCRDWPSSPHSWSPELPDIPALMLAGEYDAATLPEWAAVAAVTAPRARLHVLPGAAHAVTWSDACAMILAEDFLVDPDSNQLPACIRGSE